MLPISLRLKSMVDYIPKGEELIDIGTDHAYLPIYATKEKIVKKAIAGEVNVGPFQRAKAHVEQQSLADFIDVRLGNGLDVLRDNEATVLTIAGMGGNLIVEILTAGFSKLSSIKRMILQPMGSEAYLRSWLCENSFTITVEKILKEHDTIYEIIVAEPSIEKIYLTSAELKFGPILIKTKNQVFYEKWSSELEKRIRILKQINDKGMELSIQEKTQQIQCEIDQIKEVLGV
jgi:tRNA (adenine22-N1)-methyltransferase